MILCISLAVSAFLFALNGRYQVTTYQGSGQLGGMMWMKCDTITGRVWDLNINKGKQWVEIIDYGQGYVLENEEQK
ncbi:MAG: hypothetical protein K9L86_04755 [Candidatus Omnitrophica bacterium]|nr:hypothetical protein [Candidatus Omnitrophota bacterium]